MPPLHRDQKREPDAAGTSGQSASQKALLLSSPKIHLPFADYRRQRTSLDRHSVTPSERRTSPIIRASASQSGVVGGSNRTATSKSESAFSFLIGKSHTKTGSLRASPVYSSIFSCAEISSFMGSFKVRWVSACRQKQSRRRSGPQPVGVRQCV